MRTDQRVSPPALILWAGVQAAAILLAATDFPVWAHHPYPRGALALNELLVIDILAAAMLSPLLATSWWTILINVSITLPFAQLAGLLASAPQTATMVTWLAIILWIFGLCGLARQTREHGSYRLICVVLLYVSFRLILGYPAIEPASNHEPSVLRSVLIRFAGNLSLNDAFTWMFLGAPLTAAMTWFSYSHLTKHLRRTSIPFHML